MSAPESESRYRSPAGNGTPPRDEPTQLEFTQAMRDFHTMFPMLDDDVIEAVLRSNNGVVDSTIDQLLTMTVDCDDQKSGIQESSCQDSIPVHVRSQMLKANEPPKYGGGLPSYDDIMSGSFPSTPKSNTPPPKQPHPSEDYKPRHVSQANKSTFLIDDSDLSDTVSNDSVPVITKSPYSPAYGCVSRRRWKPPLLGKLPDDFLRISVNTEHGAIGVSSSPHEPEYAVSSHHKSSHSSSSEKKPSRAHVSAGARPKSSPTSGGNAPRRVTEGGLSSKVLMQRMQENKQKRMSIPSDQNPEAAQVLQDEYLALMLQNEEFLQELQQDQDFMMTLERDRLNATAFEFGDGLERRRSVPISPQLRQTESRSPQVSRTSSVSSRTPTRHSISGSPLNHSSNRRSPLNHSTNSTPAHQPSPLCPVPPSDPAETSTSPAPWANWELPEPPRIQPLGTDEDLPIVIDKEYCPEPVERARNDDMNGLNMERPSEDQIVGYGDDNFRTLDAFPYSKDFAGPGNAEFRRQLKYMGKSSRKKFADAAKRFFSRRKKPPRQLLRDSNAPSQMNLLESIEYDEKYNRPSPSDYTSFS